MIDVNQITSTLRGMPDQQLQQYAMMHKGDPYILSLAVSESNQRKQMRTAAQGQAGGQQMPKVADTAIAGMSQQQLPENQGIAQIPAPNMQSMADGGIAGYGDDGEQGMATGGMGGMFDFAQRSEPVLRMAEGGAVQRYQFGGVTYDPATGIPISDPSAYGGTDDRTMLERLGVLNPENRRALERAAKEKAMREEEAKAAKTPGAKAAAAVANTTANTSGQPGAAPGAQPAEKQGLGSLSSTKVLTPEQAKEQAGEFADFGEARTALKKAESDQESQGARLRTMLADNLPKTPAMEGLEKLLDKQDAATGGEKDKAAGLALLSAGLAIAGGSSRFALQNLKEAIPAVAQYSDALKDIKKMERENMKMRGEIEQARRAESRDDTKLKLQLEEKIGDRQDKINELGIGLTSKIAGTNAEVATKLWSTSFEAANREKVAGISANAQANSQLNLYKQLGSADPNSALAKGFQMYKQEGMEPRMYSEYVKLATDPMKGEEFQKRYPSFEVYKAGMGGGQGQIYTDNNVNPNAVRTR
jgi:hypothetical protein